jgi:hypothetical protein
VLRDAIGTACFLAYLKQPSFESHVVLETYIKVRYF